MSDYNMDAPEKESGNKLNKMIFTLITLSMVANGCFALFSWLEITPGIDFEDLRIFSILYAIIQLVFISLIMIFLVIRLCMNDKSSEVYSKMKMQWSSFRYLTLQIIGVILVLITLFQYIADNKLYKENQILDQILILGGNQGVGVFNVMESRFITSYFLSFLVNLMLAFVALREVQNFYRHSISSHTEQGKSYTSVNV